MKIVGHLQSHFFFRLQPPYLIREEIWCTYKSRKEMFPFIALPAAEWINKIYKKEFDYRVRPKRNCWYRCFPFGTRSRSLNFLVCFIFQWRSFPGAARFETKTWTKIMQNQPMRRRFTQMKAVFREELCFWLSEGEIDRDMQVTTQGIDNVTSSELHCLNSPWKKWVLCKAGN